MHLITHCFVAGSVTAEVGGVEECAADAEVVLSRGGNELARAKTDLFGDFRFDRLEKNSGPYQLAVSSESSGSAATDFDLGEDSIHLGAIALGEEA